MKKISSKQTGNSILDSNQTIVSLCMVFAWCFVIAAMYLSGFNVYLIIVVMGVIALVIGHVFIQFIMNKKVFYRIMRHFSYVIRNRRGKAEVNTLTMSIEQLKKRIPIEQIHDNGLIEYKNSRYGVLFVYDPPTVSMGEYDVFHASVERIVHSFNYEIEISFHFYNMISHSNPLKDECLNDLNQETLSRQQKVHIHGLYEESTKNKDEHASSEYLMSIKFGTFESVELAEKAYNTIIPGLVKSLRERGIYSLQVIGIDEIIMEFHKLAVMEKPRWV